MKTEKMKETPSPCKECIKNKFKNMLRNFIRTTPCIKGFLTNKKGCIYVTDKT